MLVWWFISTHSILSCVCLWGRPMAETHQQWLLLLLKYIHNMRSSRDEDRVDGVPPLFFFFFFTFELTFYVWDLRYHSAYPIVAENKVQFYFKVKISNILHCRLIIKGLLLFNTVKLPSCLLSITRNLKMCMP